MTHAVLEVTLDKKHFLNYTYCILTGLLVQLLELLKANNYRNGAYRILSWLLYSTVISHPSVPLKMMWVRLNRNWDYCNRTSWPHQNADWPTPSLHIWSFESCVVLSHFCGPWLCQWHCGIKHQQANAGGGKCVWEQREEKEKERWIKRDIVRHDRPVVSIVIGWQCWNGLWELWTEYPSVGELQTEPLRPKERCHCFSLQNGQKRCLVRFVYKICIHSLFWGSWNAMFLIENPMEPHRPTHASTHAHAHTQESRCIAFPESVLSIDGASLWWWQIYSQCPLTSA